ncbi:hypothetical protein Deipr_1752 [Deinococcus proteolyticus MRP]|uniref:Uncharacterized protein n=1 Tax=Deinococcus proteolyticus (strain ATCC 35074 / DSM 20540 / JCM 6276 / NBRC 101906 / NCIMB 13154 / VKM Ac-1939 / CCM 2703 / MRP) TaxID=693977 RepID=F0RL93_DEIPM|nr:hypothetical protein [Deinococcus proteolyticus]ADY26885.1 hypothetical protein Deipr_1752 [Deinococcus proteolyticus MRP]
MCSQVKDIVSIRLSHCRAERAASEGQYHLAALHYRNCLEAAERREDSQAVRFFALRLAHCYTSMGLSAKAQAFADLAEYAPAQPVRRRPDSDAPAGGALG